MQPIVERGTLVKSRVVSKTEIVLAVLSAVLGELSFLVATECYLPWMRIVGEIYPEMMPMTDRIGLPVLSDAFSSLTSVELMLLNLIILGTSVAGLVLAIRAVRILKSSKPKLIAVGIFGVVGLMSSIFGIILSICYVCCFFIVK